MDPVISVHFGSSHFGSSHFFSNSTLLVRVESCFGLVVFCIPFGAVSCHAGMAQREVALLQCVGLVLSRTDAISQLPVRGVRERSQARSRTRSQSPKSPRRIPRPSRRYGSHHRSSRQGISESCQVGSSFGCSRGFRRSRWCRSRSVEGFIEESTCSSGTNQPRPSSRRVSAVRLPAQDADSRRNNLPLQKDSVWHRHCSNSWTRV